MLNIGSISAGRPNLGESMPVFVYRMLELSVFEVLIEEFGEERANDLIRKAGNVSGRYFFENYMNKEATFNEFVSDLQDKMSEHKIGILRIEKADLENGELLLCVYEDLDCSGLPVTDETICVYDEGFIAGILECYTGIVFNVREIDCWATGARVCRFQATKA